MPLRHNLERSLKQQEAENIVGQPEPATKTNMGAYTAIAILDGFYDGEVTRELVIEASRWIRDHGPRGVLAGNGTRNAIALANAADAGELEDI